MSLKQSVRKVAKQGNLVPAVVRAVRNNKVTVQLSGTGSIMRMLDITGGPVVVGQAVHVDFTTTPPVVVAPTPNIVDVIDGGARKIRKERAPAQQSPVRPESNMIEVYAGPPPSTGRPEAMPKAQYTPDESGLRDALSICDDGDVVYIPACSIAISGDIISFPTIYESDASPINITVIGRGRNDTVITNNNSSRSFSMAFHSGVSIRDLSITSTISSNTYTTIAAYVMGDCSFHNCLIEGVNSGSQYGYAVYSAYGARMKFYTCEIIGDELGVGTNGEGTYSLLTWQSGFQAANYSVNPAYQWYDEDTNEKGITFGGESGFPSDFFNYTGGIYLLRFPRWKYRNLTFKVRFKLQVVNNVTSGSPLHYMEDNTKWVNDFGGGWPWGDAAQMDSSDNGPVKYVNGVLQTTPYGDGDYIEFEWSNTTYTNNDYWLFMLSRHSTYDYPGISQTLVFKEIFFLYPDGSKEYLYPLRGHAYLEDCSVYTNQSNGVDLYAAGQSVIEVNNTIYNTEKTVGYIVKWYNGHPGAVIAEGGLMPVSTYPGMVVYVP